MYCFVILAECLFILWRLYLVCFSFQDYQEIKIPLSDIPVNPHTTSELIRLCLRKQDGDSSDEENNADDEDEDENEVVCILHYLFNRFCFVSFFFF